MIKKQINDGRATDTVDYAKHQLLVARDGDDIVATSPSEGIAFFFQADDGIRVYKVTGVQTCALPIRSQRTGAFVQPQPEVGPPGALMGLGAVEDRKSTRLNSSHLVISYAVFCLK